MSQVYKSASIKAPASKVWEIVSDFNAIPNYVEAIISSEIEGSGIGAVRTITLGDGSQAKEKLESLDDSEKTYKYSLVESGLPIKNYLCTVSVRKIDNDVCEIIWSSTFEPDGAPEAEGKNIIEGLYAMACSGLKKLCE